MLAEAVLSRAFWAGLSPNDEALRRAARAVLAADAMHLLRGLEILGFSKREEKWRPWCFSWSEENVRVPTVGRFGRPSALPIGRRMSA